MKRIVFIGAGSFGFTRCLVRDILSFPALADSAIVSRNDSIKEAYRIRLELLHSPFEKAVELTPKCAQILQDQYYMVPLYMEKYQYVLRWPRLLPPIVMMRRIMNTPLKVPVPVSSSEPTNSAAIC